MSIFLHAKEEESLREESAYQNGQWQLLSLYAVDRSQTSTINFNFYSKSFIITSAQDDLILMSLFDKVGREGLQKGLWLVISNLQITLERLDISQNIEHLLVFTKQ